ncbi:MAG: hypothetical protein CL916_08975 [Deltaproteobacteria bacterium]|nr:hypothetical protein [Deltaproteobacteria bacterium]
MQQYSSLGKGWLGPMFHAEHNGELFRLHDLSNISVSLRDDLHIREDFHTAVQHPNIVPIMWFEENSILAPYQDGISMEQLITQGGCSDREILEYILVRTNELFSFVHAQDWIHGDVHPGLIYLTQDGEILIEGFGRRPQNKETMYTSHHRYLSPEPKGTISSDLYGIGVIILEIALGEHILLGDLLEDLHSIRVKKYVQRIKVDHPLCASFVELALNFDPEKRKEAPKEVLSLLGEEPPSHWLRYCQKKSKEDKVYRPDATDPMDIVFQTEEIFENPFPTSEEITHHELTEEFFVDVSLKDQGNEKDLPNPTISRMMLVLLAIIVVLLLILVYMQSP